MDQIAGRLPLPPDELSYAKSVERDWEKLRRDVDNGLSVDYGISLIEARIARGSEMLERNESSSDFDWQTDLSAAEKLHKRHLQWVEDTTETVDRLYKFWEDAVREKGELATKITLAGLQIMFAINGALALGAVNALTSGSQPHKSLYAVALSASAVGILLTGAAHWALAVTLAGYTNVIKAALAHRPSMKKLMVLHRFNKHLKTFRRSSYLLNAAIGWVALSLIGCTAFAVYLHWS